MDEKKLIIFEGNKIRRVWQDDSSKDDPAGPSGESDWYYSVVDVVGILSESNNPRNYWNMLKTRELENGIELYTNCVQLKMKSNDGKSYLTDCANKKGIFRIIQSIPSKKAEPFKLWLAKVGSDRIDEIENPELAQERMKKCVINVVNK